MIVETAGPPATITAGTLRARLAQPFWPAEWKCRAGLMLAVLLAGGVRSVRLMSLFPVLVDEAIYMRWAEIIQHQHTWYISLLDAKPPLSYWVYAVMRLFTPHDPLLGSRLVSVAAGTLCVVVVYRVGFLCAGETAGVITALLYSVLPYGVFYDRIAYVDSMVNLCGVSLVYATVLAFGTEELSWGRTLRAGLVFGIALFVKTTILLYGLVPVAVGLYLHRRRFGRLAIHLATLYGAAALFPLWSQLAIPPGPTFSVNNVLVHHTNFFAPAAMLLRYPLVAFDFNGRQLAGYVSAYIGSPALLAIPAAIAVP
jgi:4-amino-4-deoxy-L-arabinose transferase-like glycosyltransferase